MNARRASLSLDLDNLWCYLRVQGDPEWQKLPCFLDRVVPQVLTFFQERSTTITVFVVGQDAALADRRDRLREIASAGHEIGNHSFGHEPAMAEASFTEVERDIALAHETIADATGIEPRGFRGPGFATSEAMLRVLRRRGYRYDASRVPTFVGPLARQYYFYAAKLSREERRRRGALFGKWSDVLAPNRAHRVATPEGSLVEVPVTTMPLLRLPIHLSYVHYLDQIAPVVARTYFATALDLCRATGTMPSLLLHPLDFLGGDDVPELRFFPGMRLEGERKRKATATFVDAFLKRFEGVPMAEHAAVVA
ncbi:MAG: polysaccharide deacetylase family protein [Candidatus Eremiobacteraeota bacterium]|nr:polysaccharide deacetylase family protein [Candidatus Eremiobacteraeota bacterium]